MRKLLALLLLILLSCEAHAANVFDLSGGTNDGENVFTLAGGTNDGDAVFLLAGGTDDGVNIFDLNAVTITFIPGRIIIVE